MRSRVGHALGSSSIHVQQNTIAPQIETHAVPEFPQPIFIVEYSPIVNFPFHITLGELLCTYR
jgi:hypothetical protein